MNQHTLKIRLEAIIADLNGRFEANVDVPQSTVAWLLRVTQAAAFGEAAADMDREGAARALSQLEAVTRVPMRLEARIRQGRSLVRTPEADFFVEFRSGDTLVAEGAAPVLALAVMHAARSLAQKGKADG